MNDKTVHIVDILIHKYELHKKELLLQIELYNRQTKYIQIYGAFLFAFLSLSHKTLPGVQTKPLPEYTVFVLLLFGAFIVFYLVATIMASVFMFIIIRRRMAYIETKLNILTEEKALLEYETRIAPNFLENNKYNSHAFAPHFLSGIFRLLLFLSIIAILIAIAYESLSFLPYWIYFGIIIPISAFLIWQYITLYKNGKGKIEAFINYNIK